MTGPFVVKHLEPARRQPCDADCGGARCQHDATVKVTSGFLAGDHYCTRHANKLLNGAWTRERVASTVVVSVKAFETLEEVRVWLQRQPFTPEQGFGARQLPSAHRLASGETFRMTLPDGREIVVEATTWVDVILAARDADQEVHSSASTDAEILAAFNAAMAERYGTEGR